MRNTNYYRAKGSYSRPGAEAKKKAKEPAFVDAKGPGEEGTDELVNNYTKGTPGQDTNWRSVKEEKKPGLWANIHAKRKRIAAGADEKMRKKGDPGAPTPEQMKKAGMKEEMENVPSAAKKPVKIKRDGKETVEMRPEKMKVQTEAAIKVRSQNDVRAMLFDFVSEYIDKESVPNLMKLAKVIGKSLKKSGSGFMIECVLDEKKLTPAELKKREEIAKSIERDNPNMPMDKKMAIATAAAKRVAEMNFHEFRQQLEEAKATMCGRCGTKHVKPSEGGTCPAVKEEVEQVEENNSAPQTAAHRRAQMGSRSSDIMKKRQADNEKARQALKDPDHNPSWAKSKSRMESVELDENVKKAYEIMKPTKSMDHGIEAIKKHMKVDHNTATNMAKQVMDKVKKGEFKEGTNLPFEPDAPKPAQKNSDGSKTNPMSRAKQLAKAGLKKKIMGEAKSFDQKFKDHLKFSTSKSPAVQNYMKKKVADRDAMNKKNDPNAAKKGYALTAVPPERAYNKARKKGMSASDASQAVGTASRNRGRKLPESTEE